MASLTTLAPRTGEHILDIGCGPGFLTVELARAVGDEGRVTGFDPSPDMIATAQARAAGRPNVSIMEGSADSIPLDDSSVDRAVSIQVFEYIADLPAALSEVHRVLKPGARLVIADMHFDSLIWHSEDRDRMQRMMAAWNHHVVETGVAALLPPSDERRRICRRERRPPDLHRHHHAQRWTCLDVDAPNGALLPSSTGLMEKSDVEAWSEEQHRFAREGRFFFSLTQFIISARKL